MINSLWRSMLALMVAASAAAAQDPGPTSTDTHVWDPALYGLAFVDAPYCRAFSFGGSLQDHRTLQFDPAEARWTAVRIAADSATITGRLAPGMNWDPLQQRVILFGGLVAAPSDDTWAFDPARRTWARLIDSCETSLCPSARYHHAQIWSSALGGTVVFGGMGAATPLGDTWFFDGAWHPIEVPGPPARHAAVFAEVGDEDPVNRGKLLLYGGFDRSNHRLSDAWIFDPLEGDWQEVRGGVDSRWRGAARIVRDTCSGTNLVFGEPARRARQAERLVATPNLSAFEAEPGINASSAACKSSATTLCLMKNRFEVGVTFTNQFNGQSGIAKSIKSSDVAGFFYFSDRTNFELMVKILQFPDVIKVFYGQLTNLQFEMTVTDTTTGVIKTYHNTSGDCGGIDQTAFSAAGAAVAQALTAPAATCKTGPNTLCFLKGRFKIEVDWHNQFNGTSGRGGAVRSSDLIGMVYFTDRSNIELVIKMLQFPDSVRLFYGVLSDLEYTITVTDMASGSVKAYHNPPGRYCGGIDNDVAATGPQLVVFTDSGSGFSTTEVRDVEEEVVRFDDQQHLIWAATGAVFSGWPVNGNLLRADQFFQVRFGARTGQRRAYFTETERGTICEIEVVNGDLLITPTDQRP